VAKKTARRATASGGKGGSAQTIPPDVDLSYIAEPLRPLVVPIDSLHLDPANARKHSGENLAAIGGSLAQFTQVKPVVVQQQGRIVRAGNGTWQTMKREGREYIAAVVMPWDDLQAAAFGIADNRTAELAEWDEEVLAELLQSFPSDLEGFDQDVGKMLEGLAEELDLFPTPDTEGLDDADPSPTRYMIFVECDSEATHRTLLEELDKRSGVTARGQFT